MNKVQQPKNIAGRYPVKEYLTTKECGRLIGRSAGAVRNLVLRRNIPFRKPGGRLMFLRSEIDAWIQNAPGIRIEEIID